jgi:hypothetical protein
LSEIQTDKTQPSDFARALNSMMDNLENVVVNFQKTLLVMLEKIEKLESLEKSPRGDTAPNEKEPNTEKIKQLTNDATTSAEMPHQESSETHNETEMATNTRTTVIESGISKRSIFAGTFGKIIQKVSSKSNYCILAIALAILGIILVKLYFMLFP